MGKIIYSNKTRFEKIHLRDGDYLFMFEMRDMQNHSYFSRELVITITDGKIAA